MYSERLNLTKSSVHSKLGTAGAKSRVADARQKILNKRRSDPGPVESTKTAVDARQKILAKKNASVVQQQRLSGVSKKPLDARSLLDAKKEKRQSFVQGSRIGSRARGAAMDTLVNRRINNPTTSSLAKTAAGRQLQTVGLLEKEEREPIKQRPVQRSLSDSLSSKVELQKLRFTVSNPDAILAESSTERVMNRVQPMSAEDGATSSPTATKILVQVPNNVTFKDVSDLFNFVGPTQTIHEIRENKYIVAYKNKDHATTAVERFDNTPIDGVPMKVKLVNRSNRADEDVRATVLAPR